jgi:DNA (cytosine-5)-methyltransferase 1
VSTPRKPRALDLFCCAGGAGMGLHLAGFEVVGVDVRPQPRYPFTFHQADALTFPLDGFDFIWASPPCQAHTAMKTMHNAKAHADLIPATRAKLAASGKPHAIENVVGAPLCNPVLLCGTMFGLGTKDAELRRHRLFETSHHILAPECQHGSRGVIGVYGGHLRNRKRVRTIGVYGEGCRDSRRKHDKAHPDFSVEDGRAAMGIDWMTLAELCQAIPPAFSRYIAEQMMPHVLRRMTEAA